MTTRSQTILIAVLLGLVIPTCRAEAIGKSTVDPNVAGAATKAESFDSESDARLARKVTYEARYRTVSAILADLSRSTGVTLKAGYNNQDWQVRDRKMNVFAKDLPLATLMSSIARVMKFKWSISRDARPWTYRLYMDRKTLLDADAKRARRIQKNIEWQTNKREAWIKDIADVGKLSDADYEKLKEQNPYLYMYRKTGISDALDAFFKAAPELANAFATGQEMSLRVSDLSPATEQATMQLSDARRILSSIRSGKGITPPPEPVPDASSIGLIINEGIDRVAREGANSLHMGWITVRYGPQYSEQDLITPFPNPDFETTKLFGTEWVQSLEEGKSGDQVAHPRSQIDAAQIADRVRFGQDDTPEEKPKEHPDDPALQKKLKCQPEDTRLASVLAEIAKNSELSTVSDSFGRPYTRPAMIQGEMTARELLDKIETVYDEDWERNGAILELRDKEWFMKRSAQLPEAWLEKWRQEAKNTGTLDLDTLWQINKLSYDQLRMNLLEDDILGKMSLHADSNLMKIYDCLEPSQRRTVTSTSGATIQLSDTQITTLADLLKSKGTPVTDVTLTTTRKSVGKHFEYEMRLAGPDRVQLGVWKQATPEYTPPEDKPAKAR